MVTYHERLSVPPKYDQDSHTGLEELETVVNHWRRLDGSTPGWKQEDVDIENDDCILQVPSLEGLCMPEVLCNTVCSCHRSSHMHGLLMNCHTQQAFHSFLSACQAMRDLQGTQALLCCIADKLLCKALIACQMHQHQCPVGILQKTQVISMAPDWPPTSGHVPLLTPKTKASWAVCCSAVVHNQTYPTREVKLVAAYLPD